MKATLRSFLVATLLLVPAARADEWFVPGDFDTIQEAIAASSGITLIHVGAGTWAGPIDTLDLQITIRGEGPGVTIIDGGGAPYVVQAGLGAATSRLDLEKVTVTGGVDGVVTSGSGIADLSHCEVSGNSGVGGRGHITASHCTFADNGSHGVDTVDALTYCTFAGNGGWGVQQVGAPAHLLTLENCDFLDNGLGGARLSVSSFNPALPAELLVQRCVFVNDNLQVGAIQGDAVAPVTVRQVTMLGGTLKLMQGTLFATNCILRSPAPIADLSTTGSPDVSYCNLPGSWLPGTGNIDVDPLLADPEGGDFSLLPGSPCINTGNPASGDDPDGTVADMGAVTYEPWTWLGGGVTGVGLQSYLAGSGGLVAGDPMGLKLFDGPPGFVWLIVSVNELGAPFKGGVLWPAPDLVLPAGPPLFNNLIVVGSWPAGLPAGLAFVSQAWWQDATAPQGWAASNGLRGTQP